jgi:hypothetical protein
MALPAFVWVKDDPTKARLYKEVNRPGIPRHSALEPRAEVHRVLDW